jgi:hypothetical protein
MPSYPDISDYTDSVQNAAGQVIDPILRNAKPRLKGNKPEMMSGGVAVVYPFQDGGDIYAVKCWLRDIGDLRDHYRRVQGFLASLKSAYFVDFAYVEKGVIAKDQIWPFLRMKWVGGKSLLEFVSANLFNSTALTLLADRYVAMSQQLHRLGVAHGDLQGSNIKVVGSGAGIDFQLIDYDTLIVPAAYGRKADAIALPSYQHPARGASRNYTGKEDYFSELVIYVSLLAVAEKPSMWSRYPKGDPGLKDEDRHDKDMLFVKEDFLSDRPTEVFRELIELSPLVKNLALVLWNYTRSQAIEQLLALEDVVKIARDSVHHSHDVSNSSEFGALLRPSAETAWLNDSAFITRPPHVPATVAIQSTGHVAASFEDLLAANRLTSDTETKPIANGIAVSPPRTKPPSIWPQIKVIMIGGSMAVLGIFLLFLITANDNSRPSSNAPPQPVASTPADEDAKVRRRNMWQADLQRRQQQSDATFAGLTKRFNQGLAAYEVESFNADVKIAERVRESLEVEINAFNSGGEIPSLYQTQ